MKGASNFCILLVMLVLVGCQSSQLDQGNFDAFLQRAAHSPKQTGDFGTFFTQQISRYSGQTVGGSVPTLNGTWYSEADHDGFATQLYGISFRQVQDFMLQVYGEPVDVYTNAMPGWIGLYAIPHDVAVQFFGGTNGVGFICMKSNNKP